MLDNEQVLVVDLSKKSAGCLHSSSVPAGMLQRPATYLMYLLAYASPSGT